MDESLNNNEQGHTTAEFPAEEQRESMENNADHIRKFAMDNRGNIRESGIRHGMNGTAVITGNTRLYIILGWVSAAFTAFISPLFAIPGIVFGVLLNRQSRGKGNAIIITNIVLAAINIIFGFGIVLMALMGRMMRGY